MEMKRKSKPKAGRVLTSRVYPIKFPLMLKDEESKLFYIFKGITKNLFNISCHISALSPGHSPHTPHAHKEEEVLLILSGSIDIIFPDRLSPKKDQYIHLNKGQFAYYPSGIFHTLQATGKTPANYLIFKWYTVLEKGHPVLPFKCFNMLNHSEHLNDKKSFSQYHIFEGSTNCLQKLHCHISVLQPGAGYEPHSDTYDVSILVLEVELETLGQRAKPYDVIFYAAGESHGMHNPGTAAARYIVFEFHVYNKTFKRVFNALLDIFTRVTDPGRWKRKLRHLF